VEENRLPVSGESLVSVYWWEVTTSERPCSRTLADHLGSVRCNRKHDLGKVCNLCRVKTDISAVLTARAAWTSS
jgi:hypothetical protein